MEREAFPPPINKTTTLSLVATISITTLEALSATISMQQEHVTITIKHTMKLQHNLEPITTNIISICQRKG